MIINRSKYPQRAASQWEPLVPTRLSTPDRPRAIPRISHDQRQTTASGGIWLHSPETSQGRRSAPELACLLVAGVGFEPT